MPSNYEKITKYNEEQLGKDTASRKSQVNMYSDFSHFVFEILQNADDYGATTITFNLTPEMLIIEHNGIPFKEENVEAISYFGKSTSRDDLIKTGHFGVGFKSVFALTATPFIHSGDESFKIYGLYRLEAIPSPADLKAEKTRICLPFNHFDDQPDFVETLVSKETVFDKISRRLKSLDMTTLLFTRNVSEIKWGIQDEEGHYLRVDEDKERISEYLQTRKTEITDGNSLHTYLVFSRSITWKGKEYKPVEIAFFLDDTNKTIRSIKKPLLVLFPTTQETYMGFIMNGPFRTPPHRETVSPDDEFNQFLTEEMTYLICDALPQIREIGKLTVTLLETLPIRMVDFPKDGMFYPIVEAVRNALLDQELLPADDGTFVSARYAKFTEGKLRTLLTPGHLQSLFSLQEEIKWLSGEITRSKPPDLYSYLMNELNVDEITPDGFARKITHSFLENQSDEWMTSFYHFLNDRTGLWKKDTDIYGNYVTPGPLWHKSFIRLQDGTHVPPFDEDRSPNAYLPLETDTEFPIVSPAIVKDEKALEFLKKLGLTEPDVVAEVLDKVLPKYTKDVSHVSFDEHLRDMEKIQRAYSIDSWNKRRLLLNNFNNTPFIYAENPALQQKTYKKAGDLYLRYSELLMYFDGNEDIWFISSEYDNSIKPILKELGVTDSIRVQHLLPNRKGQVEIRDYSCHKRGLNSFDPTLKIDGLEYALNNPTERRSRFVWNMYAIRYSNCIGGVVEWSSKQDFSDDASNSGDEEQISDFGKLLMNTAWLPDTDGFFHKPNELKLDDLPESFKRDEKLSDQLGMKKDVIAKLAEKAGVQVDDIEWLRKHPNEFQQFRANIAAQDTSKPAFPTKKSTNPERRREQLSEQVKDAPEKEYEKRNRSVRTTDGTIDKETYLRDTYTNEDGQMICQICEEEMPFKKRDGEYYFEGVELFNRDVLPKEHEAQYLALCPLCHAKYKEFVKPDKDAVERLKLDIIGSEEPEISIQLDKPYTVRFVEKHFLDIKTILRNTPYTQLV